MSFCKDRQMAHTRGERNLSAETMREMSSDRGDPGLDLEENHHALYAARLEHTRKGMRRHDVPAMLIVDPNQITYTTGFPI